LARKEHEVRQRTESIRELVDGLTYARKVDRALGLIREAREEFGPGLFVASSLGKDSSVVWSLASRVDPAIEGFVITTRFKPPETVRFMEEEVARSEGRLHVFQSDARIPDRLYETDPDACCHALKVEPTRRAVEELGVTCWTTGLRCTEGRTRTDFGEIEERDEGLTKLNPILIWHEREVWQYIALERIRVNPLYGLGYRSLGCLPCTNIVADSNERAGRWVGTSKCGGECGIHTRPLRASEALAQ
jgi:phosphoadenylyl-sulfate reductase (thioredoxin)